MSKLRVERSIWINAPRERVWRAITDPEQIQQWFSPTTPWKLTELELGGVLHAVGYEQLASRIVILEPPHKFAYLAAACPPYTTMSVTTMYTLDEENGGTRVTITETGFDAPKTEEKPTYDNNVGYGMALENLRAYIEGMDLPYPEGF